MSKGRLYGKVCDVGWSMVFWEGRMLIGSDVVRGVETTVAVASGSTRKKGEEEESRSSVQKPV